MAPEKKTILLIDDEELIIDVGAEMLQALGYQVKTATTGTEALAVFKEKKDQIDLVILDMVLPDQDGAAVFAALRRCKKNVKVLISTGYNINEEISHLLEGGCAGFIQKPFSLGNLDEQIQAIL